MAQPVETATDYKHTHKDHGLIMVNVYGFVFQESSDRQTHRQTDKQTDATKRIISPASRSITMKHFVHHVLINSTLLISRICRARRRKQRYGTSVVTESRCQRYIFSSYIAVY